jgi:hypothetical protein
MYFASRPPEARGRACAGAAGASYASCRSGSIFVCLFVRLKMCVTLAHILAPFAMQ